MEVLSEDRSCLVLRLVIERGPSQFRADYISRFQNQFSADGFMDMTAYTYDRMVPIVLSGFGIKNGLYATPADVVDIAPTLAFVMGVLPPALSEGRLLSEALK